MIAAIAPDNESARLETLRRYGILDTASEQPYDDVVALAAEICKAPIALVSLTDECRQWFKASLGIQKNETPREFSFCSHAILEPGVLIVRDAGQDPRFCDHPGVTSPGGARFYAGAPIVTPNGHALGTVCVIDHEPRDLTPGQTEALAALARQVLALLELREQARTRDGLSATLREMAHLLDDSQQMARVGGWSIDLASGDLSWTDQTYRIHDLTPATYRPTVESAIAFYAPQSLPRIQAAIETAAANRQPFDLELELITATGRHIWVNTTGKAVVENGQVKKVLGAFRDITEQRHVAAELKAAKEAAEAASEAKSRFLATMSHEIRTPMNAVLGYASLLGETDLDATQREHLRIIERSSEALLGLINNVLDFAQIEAGRLDVEHIEFDLHRAAGDVLLMLRPKADAKGIDLVLDLGDDVPQKVEGDPVRLGQVLLNLVNNAVKFTNQGGVTLQITTAADGIRAEVRDTGIGIPADRVAKIFEEFTQAAPSTHRRYGGTGLGLAICRRLVELMGGRIGATSRLRKGSTFWFQMPLRATQPTANAPADEAPTSKIGGAGCRVLLAEDNKINQHLATAFLKRLDCEVEIVNNGVEAVEAAAKGDYALILMDCLMPEMDGYEAARQIRSREAEGNRERVPIIAVTANARTEDRIRCEAAGMDDYLGKPFRREQLERVIVQWSRATESGSPPAITPPARSG
ncbi:MAG: ATP-binding protein [bacterium]|nr:ATP-binding protein [bacterium]